MKHLFALVLILLAVSTAWSSPATASPGDERSGQVTLTQHQEAALPAALDGTDLVGAHLVASAQSAPHIEAAYSVDVSQTAILDQEALDGFDGPARPVQTSLNDRPMTGYRRPVETSGPVSWKAAIPHRCPGYGATASAILLATISSGA